MTNNPRKNTKINPLNYTKIRRTGTKKLLVFISFLLVFVSGLPTLAQAAEAYFYLSPSQGNYRIGDNFSVGVLINVEGMAINAAQAKIYFPVDKLKVLEVSKQNSIFTLWPEDPNFSNQKGEISFIGGLPSPGFLGKSGKVITILFQGKAEGQARVYFGQEKILANDPKGTDIFAGSQEGNYSIFPPEKIPPKVPVEDTQPPLSFEITFDNEGDPTNPQPLLYFETKDELSGMSHYEIKIGEKDFFKVEIGKTMPLRMPLLTPGTYLIIVRAFDKAENFSESQIEIKIESILVPEITVCPRTFRAGEEKLFLAGTSLPETKQIIFFEKDGEIIKQWEVFSNKEGDWSLVKEELFRSGIYKIFVKTEDKRGAISNPSEVCFVKVILGGISIGPLILSYKTLTLVGLIFLILLLVFISYLFRKIRKTRKLIEIETLDLKKKFYKEYNELKSNIEKELEEFKKLTKERELTPEEKKRQEELLKDLEDVERVLKEELKDIEEIE